MSRLVSTCVLVLGLAGCATPQPQSASLTMTSASLSAPLFAGSAAWSVRRTSSGREDVVTMPGIGEIAMDAEHCRLVRALDRGALLVWSADHVPCADPRGDRLCFEGVSFGPPPGGSGERVTVNGCANKNEIFLERVVGGEVATVAPRAFVERCAPVPAEHASYLRVVSVYVDDNDLPRHGLRFRYDDGFEVCFLSRLTGHFSVVVDVEDPSPRQLTIEGEVDDI